MWRALPARAVVIAVLLAATLAAATAAHAEKRALVIGNGDYLHMARLPNAAGDASAMADLFRRIGFDRVDLHHNLALADARRVLDEFAAVLGEDDTVVVLFAGHGIETDGVAYLMPVDARLAAGFDPDTEAIPLGRLIDATAPARRLRLIMLDASRTDPFGPLLPRRGSPSPDSRARLARDGDALVVFATTAGSTAGDEAGRSHSPFVAALLEHLATPGLDLRQVLGRVRDSVLATTQARQAPFVIGSIGPVVLVPAPLPSRPADPPARPQVAAAPPPPVVAVPDAARTVPARALLYEEDLDDRQGRRLAGSVTWRKETADADAGRPFEIVVRADIAVPARGLTVAWLLRRNTDKALPATHVIDVAFTLPPDFPGGGLQNVPGILLKLDEGKRGAPLAGLAVRVTPGVYMIGLSNLEQDRRRNLELLRERTWIDRPIVYRNNRRAILTFEKGETGERVFAEALAAWGQ